MKFNLNKIPSFLWVFIILGVIAGGIGLIIAFFVALGTVPGFGSLIILILLGLYVIGYKKSDVVIPPDAKLGNFAKGFFIFFCALMATVIDQTGNIVYNKPIELLFCRNESVLVTGVDISHPLPGRTDITQDFRCIGKDNKVERFIDPLDIMVVRFVEYVLIIYFVDFLAKRKANYIGRKIS